jgi:hypothetical protein
MRQTFDPILGSEHGTLPQEVEIKAYVNLAAFNKVLGLCLMGTAKVAVSPILAVWHCF